MKHFNIKKYMNEKVKLSTGVITICFSISIALILFILIVAFASAFKELRSYQYSNLIDKIFTAFLNCFSYINWFGWLVMLFSILTLLIIIFKKNIYNFLVLTFKFIFLNIFNICICLSILYVGVKMIDKITFTIEKSNNIVPVATHNGFAIYNRAEDKFFEYKKDKYDSEKYDVNVYVPSYKLEKIHREYYKK